MRYFKDTKGIILDIRNNGGGAVIFVDMLASRFASERVLVGYWQSKIGKGHTDFSEPQPIYLSPSLRESYHGKVALLTNRSCFSAANDFTQTMKVLPNVVVFGDKTGGGAGMPLSSELPCGWSLRLSVSPSMDANMQYTEFGIEPNIRVDMTLEDELQGLDTIIETAKSWILGN
jgi:C-terminal processing protease CtpA/Prc